MSSLVHIDNKKKDTLILGKGQKDGLDDTLLSAEKELILINFIDNIKNLGLILHYNGVG